jgi:long-chain acyl-CoA synthetase
MEMATVPEAFLAAMDGRPLPRAFLHKTAEGWLAIPSAEMVRRVAGLARALAELGVRRGDRVAVFAANRPEWHVADLAISGLGGVSVPLYFRESIERMAYILNDSECRVAFAAGGEQVGKILEYRGRVPSLEHIVSACAPAPPYAPQYDALQYETLIAGAGEQDIAVYRQSAATVTASQLATLIYTSGTTGEPKGVMLTHANLVSNAMDTFREYEFGPDEMALSILPLAHVYERTIDYGYIFRSIPIAYVEHAEQVQEALLEMHPTIMAAVPRVFEKTYAAILERKRKLNGAQQRIFSWALRTAVRSVPWKADGKPASLALKLEWKIADRLVYAKIREGTGGRVHSFCSGSAPLEKELAEFFWAVGLPVYEGYGLTETSPVVSANVPGHVKVGTVGRPIANVEVKIAADGEILVRGACVMQGYYHKPDATKESFTADGWLMTGDIGELDADGYLRVTDRKKELLKTASGKFVAPQLIENKLKTSPYISQAMIVGDRKKFVSALVVPDFAAVEAKAREAGITFASRSEMVQQQWVRELLGKEMDRLTQDLARYEKPKRFALLDGEFSFDNGLLTYTLKLKRREIQKRYQEMIEQLYADMEEPLPPQQSAPASGE